MPNVQLNGSKEYENQTEIYATTQKYYISLVRVFQKHPHNTKINNVVIDIVKCVCVCVCVLFVSRLQESYCSMNGYLTIVWGGYILMVGSPPPLIGILNTLRLRVPSGLFNDKHACNVMGKYIVHLYVQLLYNSDENVK